MMLGIDPDHSMGSRSCKGKKLKKDFGTKVPMGESSGTDHSAKMGLRQLQSLVQVCTYQLFIDLFRDVTPLPHNGCRRPKRRRV